MKEKISKQAKFKHDVNTLLSNGDMLCQADRIAIRNLSYPELIKYKFTKRKLKFYKFIMCLMFKEDERMLIKMAMDDRLDKLSNSQDWNDLNNIRGIFSTSLWK